MDELLLRELTPAVIGVLVHRGVDFATAEDAVQEALIQAALTWPDRQPADPKGWLVTVAWRKGTVNLLKLSGSTGMVGSGRGRVSGVVGQAAVVVPVTSFQVVNRTVILQRYSSARSW